MEAEVWSAALVLVDVVTLVSLFAGFVFLPHRLLATMVHVLVLLQVHTGCCEVGGEWGGDRR